MSFQIQILTSIQAPAFTAPVLREARKVFKKIRMALLMPAPEQYPFRVPQFDTLEELMNASSIKALNSLTYVKLQLKKYFLA